MPDQDPVTRGDAAPRPGTSQSATEVTVAAPACGLYASSDKRLEAVRDHFNYWTGKLTETSLQLSYAVIAANWATFGSLDKVLASIWSKLSIALVLVGLAFNLIGTKYMGETLRKRIDYAEGDLPRWQREFQNARGKRDPWPFTTAIDSLGRWMREAKTYIPVSAGILFLIALFTR